MRRGKKHRGGGRSLLSSIEKLVPSVLVAAPAISEAVRSDIDGRGKMMEIIYDYSGYDVVNKQWNGSRLVATYLPPVAAMVGFRIAHKINGLVRRI